MSNNLTVAIQYDGRWYSVPANGIKYVDAAPGGCISAEFVIDDDYALATLADLSPSSLVRISSKRTGKCVWSGEVDSPGLAVNPDGSRSMHVTCAGTGTMLDQRFARLPYVVTAYDAWESDPRDPSKATAQVGPGACPWFPDLQALMLTFPQGAINPGDRARMRFTGFYDSPMTFGGMSYGYGSGAVTSDKNTQYFEQRIYVGLPGFNHVPLHFTPDGGAHASMFGTADGDDGAPTGQDDLSIEFRFNRSDTGITTDKDYFWGGFWNTSVYGQRMDRNGVMQPTSPSLGGLVADQVIEDLMGRLLTGVVDKDRTRSSVGTGSTVVLNPLDYSDEPVSAADVLDDLVMLDMAYYWRADPHESTTGLFPLKWSNWGMTPRYSLPNDVVEWDQQGSEDDLCNAVTVVWSDARGADHTYRLQATPGTYGDLAQLEDAGRVREAAPVTIDRGKSSQAMAGHVAAQYLGQVATLPKAAKATVTVPLVDATTACLVAPEELLSGQIVHLPDTEENLRCTQVEYDDDTGAATLTLASPRKTAEQIIAGLQARRRRRNRR